MAFKKIKFKNKQGIELSGKIDFPLGKHIEAYAIFVHVFTGHKNLLSAKHISRALTLNGIAVLRFDFTGLGDSEGDFSETNFSTNIEDIKAAAEFLKDNYESPKILAGQSLGGAACVYAADEIDSVTAVATIGAPSEPEHVMHLLGCHIEDIELNGHADISIGGRPFTIKKQFIEDLRTHSMYDKIKQLKKAILILHSPQDEIVEIENAAKIYHAAFHPKSFVTLNEADHMLTDKEDAFYTGSVIASWVKRYIDLPEKESLSTDKQVIARLGDEGYTTEIMAGRHGLVADESEALGGDDFGPSPYELLNAALGACTAMTLQMYARRKKWDLQEVNVHLSFARSYKEDCEDCSEKDRRLDKFEKVLELKGNLSSEQKLRLAEIADRCPVHRTLLGEAHFHTSILGMN